MKRWCFLVSGLLLLVIACVGMLLLRDVYAGSAPEAGAAPFIATNAQVARGEYLARVGNCAGCHTARGGEAYAGGRAVETPFGAIYASNLTPDAETGIGAWSSSSFFRAMHEGRSHDGRLLYPAFPYPNMTLTTREDSYAIYAYLLNGVKPVALPNRPHTLSFPFNNQLALAAWRLLYFKPAQFQPVAEQSGDWNRGAYLVQGLAHCGACHSTRNALGAPIAGHAYDGALMPGGDWYAPSLTAASEASMADWELAQIASWLKVGSTTQAAALGPMAEVIYQSTQYIDDTDLLAMAIYLKALPTTEPPRAANAPSKIITQRKNDAAGAQIYAKHCASCHGENGEGKLGAYPALAGNRALNMANTTNVISIIIKGGFAPATAGNPRPHGMPPYYHLLADSEIAVLATHIRSSWGNAGSAVTELDMVRYRNELRGP